MSVHPSPFMTATIIGGIIIGGLCPPLLLVFAVLAVVAQSKHRGKRARSWQAAKVRAQAKHEREVSAAYRYFS